MTTKFQLSGGAPSWQSWCKKILLRKKTADIDGVPAELIAYALYILELTGNPFHVSESFVLNYNAATMKYFGQSAASGKRVEIEVSRLAQPDHYSITLDLFQDDNIFGTITWPDLTIVADPTFDSGLITSGGPPPADMQQIQILG